MQDSISRAIDLTGHRFNRLIVTGRAPNYSTGSRSARWHCRCDCGNETISLGSNLRSGRAKSCGCYSQEIWDQTRYKHGAHREKLYKVWTAIKQRCLNPSDKAYPNYGGRGITICNEWINDYAAFASHIGRRPSERHTVERIDNNRGYEPGNVRWATHSEQLRNKRTNRMITHDGRTMCFKDWVEESGVPHATLHWRLFTAKWSIEKALKR